MILVGYGRSNAVSDVFSKKVSKLVLVEIEEKLQTCKTLD